MTKVFKDEKEFKRVIFNVDAGLAERLEKAKEASRELGKKLDVDGAVDKALEKFLKKAEKKIADLRREERLGGRGPIPMGQAPGEDDEGEAGPPAARQPGAVMAAQEPETKDLDE